MSEEARISTGIEALDKTLDFLRPGDTVTWQMASIGDFVFIATQFVAAVALTGKRIVYLRFGKHPEVVPTEALSRRGANIRQYDLDATVGFETFSVQVHRIIKSEPTDAFYIFDCLSLFHEFKQPRLLGLVCLKSCLGVIVGRSHILSICIAVRHIAHLGKAVHYPVEILARDPESVICRSVDDTSALLIV